MIFTEDCSAQNRFKNPHNSCKKEITKGKVIKMINKSIYFKKNRYDHVHIHFVNTKLFYSHYRYYYYDHYHFYY